MSYGTASVRHAGSFKLGLLSPDKCSGGMALSDHQPILVTPASRPSAGDFLLLDARAVLFQQIRPVLGQASLGEAFVVWLLPDCGSSTPGLLQTLIPKIQHSHDYRDAATLCFAATSLIESGQQLDEGAERIVEQQLEWMIGRQAFRDGEPADYCLDPIALLGFVLGSRLIPRVKEPFVNWLNSFLPQSRNWRLGDDDHLLLSVLAQYAGHSNNSFSTVQPELADIVVALRAKGVIRPGDFTGEADQERDALALMSHAAVAAVSSPYRAALRVAAFDWIRRMQAVVVPERATVEHVVGLLQGVQASLQEIVWDDKPKTKNSQARHWHIDNEYHVQSLLWMILKPIFPDLQKELYTLQVGSKNPRADLAIPSLKLIVEAKFMRPADSTQKMIGQIAEDASLYLVPGSPYESIVAFIWDNVPRPEEHDVMIRGINKFNGLAGAVVVSRPSFMTFEEPNSADMAEEASVAAETEVQETTDINPSAPS